MFVQKLITYYFLQKNLLKNMVTSDDFFHPVIDTVEDSITYNEFFEEKEFEYPLDDQQFLGIDSFVQDYGIEILAHYKSLHLEGPLPHERWGIHFFEWGIEYLAKKIRRISTDNHFRLQRNECVILAKKKLVLHEQLHYAVEVIATRLGEIFNEPSYYEDYDNNRDNNRDLAREEEGIANSFVFHSKDFGVPRFEQVGRNQLININSTIHSKPYIHEIMRHQPAGYRDFEDYLELEGQYYNNNLKKLIRNITGRRCSNFEIHELNKIFKNSLLQKTAKEKIPYFLHITPPP